MRRRSLLGAFLSTSASAFFAIGSASAEDALKQVDKDGHVGYSDKPVAGARVLSTIPAAANKTKQPAAARRASISWTNPDLQKQQATGGPALAAARAEVRAAEDEVDVTLQRLERMRTPQPWEVTGKFPGGTRVTKGYVNRLQDLELDVAVARARLAHAQDVLARIQ